MVNKFNTSIKGYKKEEVNDFVHEVTREYENMLIKLKSSCEVINALQDELNHYKELELSLHKAIQIAEDSTSSIKKKTMDESQMILEDARYNANKLVNNALLKAEKIESDAEELRKNVVLYKRRFKSLIEDQLTEVENLEENM